MLSDVKGRCSTYSNYHDGGEEWFQKGCLLSLVVFTKKSQKLPPELWCIASRDKPPAKKNFFLRKHCVHDSECKILSQEPSDSCILYFNVIFHGK